jgi:ElaA protein
LPTAIEWHSFGELSPELLYEVLRFRQAIFVVEQRSPYADLDGIDQTALHLLLRLDGGLAGYLRLIPGEAEQVVRIGRVAVAPERRGRGLARHMMAEALDRFRRHWPEFSIALSAQAYLVPFYQSLGFAAVSAPYDDCGVPHIDMALAKPRG